jgi:hypothetical protein
MLATIPSTVVRPAQQESLDSRPDLRARVDSLIDSHIEQFYREVPYARHLRDSAEVNLHYYKRHMIEICLRIRLKRVVDAYAIRYFVKHDPIRAKAWAHYIEDEMLHDSWFAADLEKIGVPKEKIYSTEPLLATKFYMGYLLYGIEYEEDPLAHVCSVYLTEYSTTRTQPEWLRNLEKTLGADRVRGAWKHVGTDVDDDHATFVWDVLASLVKKPEDEDRVVKHMTSVARLFEAYFTELYGLTITEKPNSALQPSLVG